jgi:hypothetical protein
MKIKYSIKTLLTSLVLLVFLWVAFFITQLIYKAPEHKNEYFIPETATFAIKLDSRKLVNKTLYTLLFEGRDEQIIEKIKEIISTPGEQRKSLGINFLSDAILFSNPYKNGKLVIVSVNLSNSTNFKNNIPELLNPNQVVEVVDNVGFILTYISANNQERIKKEDISTFFAKNILPLSNNTNSRFKVTKQEGEFFQSYSKGNLFGTSTCFNSSNILFNLIENGIEMNGELSISGNKNSNVLVANQILIPKNGYFHFSSGVIPKSIQDTLSSSALKAGIELPKLKSFSLNYGGMNIQMNNEGMSVLPDMDLLLEFNSAFSISNLLKQDTLLSKIAGKFDNKTLSIGGKKYFVNQLNSKTISISVSDSPTIVSNKKNELFAIKGNISSLLKVEGGGMIVSLLEMVPAFKASKELFSNLEDVNIKVRKINSKKADLNGKIIFKKDHFVMNEMMKFILEMQFVLM